MKNIFSSERKWQKMRFSRSFFNFKLNEKIRMITYTNACFTILDITVTITPIFLQSTPLYVFSSLHLPPSLSVSLKQLQNLILVNNYFNSAIERSRVRCFLGLFPQCSFRFANNRIQGMIFLKRTYILKTECSWQRGRP